MSTQLTRILEDKVSRRFFNDLLEAYPSVIQYPPKCRYYLRTKTKTALGSSEFLAEVEAAAQRIVASRSQNVFINYEESTSGTTGSPKQCLRPSISWHLEFRRLRDVLDLAIKCYGIPPPWPDRIFYYSRYGKSSFAYSDKDEPPIHVEKYVYENVEAIFRRMEDQKQPFILSGSPSSIIDLIDLGADQFNPKMILISGERCPEKIFDRIQRVTNPVINLVVAREFGLVGWQCTLTKMFHFFSNSLLISRSQHGKLIVRDPANYLTINPPAEDDDIDILEEHVCECGFEGLSTSYFEGRPYDKGYPAL